MKRMGIAFAILASLMLFASTAVMAEDWPQWRYDSYRSANSPEQLPAKLYLQWVRKYPQLEPVWDDPLNLDLMQYDTQYEPIVMGDKMFVASNAFDRVVALNTQTGEEEWAFYTNGPVRFPPSSYQGKVYITSDDGYLYCVNASDGTLVWKYNSVSSDRNIIGNERLVSTWSARGGPVIKDGIVYFGSGIWPFMGVFLFALDAESGEELWINDSSSAPFIKQPHNSPSFAGIAPQGALVATEERLLVPGGRSVPASFNRATGEFEYYQLASSGKTGGAFVTANDNYFVNYHRDHVTNLYDIKTGERILAGLGKVPVVDGETFYCKGETVSAKTVEMKEFQKREKDGDTGESKIVTETKPDADTHWEVEIDGQGEIIKAGSRLYVGGTGQVAAIDIPQEGEEPTVSWKAAVDGDVKRIVAANGQLFVVTLDGKIYAFGGKEKEPVHYENVAKSFDLGSETEEKAALILNTIGIEEGYGLAYNIKDSNLLHAMVEQSDLYLSVVEENPSNILKWRNRFVDAGLHGKRISFKPGAVDTFNAPPYVFSVIYIDAAHTAKDQLSTDVLKSLYESLRPYGGTMYISNAGNNDSVANNLKEAGLVNANIIANADYTLVRREGALPGSADWTHQYGDIANTIKSDDQLVKLPLGILWYGGSSNMDVLPRHSHSPPEQVVGGKMFIEGMDSLSARDVYTGRVLWKRAFSDLDNFGVYYDETYKDTPLDTAYNQIHIPGANARGTNYVVTEDRIYLVKQNHCLVLDTETGKDLMTITLPEYSDEGADNNWGYVGVYEDYLIAGAGFVSYMDYIDIPEDMREKRKVFLNYDISSSKRLVVFDRYSGEKQWDFVSELGLNHNAIVAGNGLVYCIDKMPPTVTEALERRGLELPGTPSIHAFDIKTGKEKWGNDENVFGTWLGYSEEHNLLLQAGRPSRDMLYGEEGNGMMAYQASTGERLWSNDARYGGPCILHKDQIITDRYAYHLTSGEQVTHKNPLTGQESPWQYQRNYGCDYAIASENFMTFRSASAGFYDLVTEGGTGNFGGFKSSCTSNLIVANGILNAPDYTRTCSCSYQNQTSLAMIHDPDVEMWTFNEFELDDQAPIQQLGINLGAPGDRRADNGTLWLDYPAIGGPSPELPVTTEPAEPKYFLNHSSRVSGAKLKYVEASGVEGVRKISVKLTPSMEQTQKYTVRLFFMDPEHGKAGKRVFDVALQGKTVIEGLDVAKESGGLRTGIVKEFKDVEVAKELALEFNPTTGSEDQDAVLCGIEVIANNKIAQN